MKRTSIFIIVISVVSAGIFCSWLFFKYFRNDTANVLTFPVRRGDITETVEVRGEAASQKEFDLSFVSSGTVARIFVENGNLVKEGELLMKLDTTSFELEVKKLSAVLAQRQASLDKLLAGYTTEDVAVTKTKTTNAEQSLNDKVLVLKDALNDSYTKANGAIGTYVDQFYDNPLTVNARYNLTAIDAELKANLDGGRVNIGDRFVTWQNLLTKLTDNNLANSAEIINGYLTTIRDFLEQLAVAINGLTPNSTLTSATIGTYRSDISSARTAVNTATTNLTAALESVRTAQSALALANSELNLKIAGPRAEDISSAKAQISEAESDLVGAKDKIRTATLIAPIESRIMKVAVKRGEALIAGESAIILATTQNKIQADVSELDIVKIPETGGAETEIGFDAFPNQKFVGKVISIEPKEIIKDGDTYYRVNFYFDGGKTPIRSGMNADLKVKIAEKSNVLLLPSFAIYKRDGQEFVKVKAANQETEVAVITGLSDGESTEIVSGLSEGQIVTLSAD